MNYVDWIRRVDRGDPGHYLLCTIQEPYLWDGMKQVLQKDVLGGKLLSFNYEHLQARSLTPEALISVLETYPLQQERRVVVLENVPLQKEEVSKFEPFLEALADCVAHPAPHVLLVLGFDGEKPFRGKLLKSMETELERVDLAPLSASELNRFITKQFQTRGIAIQQGVVPLLMQSSEYMNRSAGKTLYDVENLVASVAGLARDMRLYLADVEDVMISPAERNIFALMDAMNARNASEALRLVRGYESLGDDPYRLFYMLVRQVRNMIGVKRAQSHNTSPGDARLRLKLSSFEFSKLQQGVRHYDEKELLALHDALFSMERRMKTGQFHLTEELERFVLRIAG